MILIDECVGPSLGTCLQLQGLKDIIAVAWNKELKGSSDDYLMEYCNDNNALLITKDKGFFDKYTDRKIFISNGKNYDDIPKELQYKLNCNSELKRLCDKVIELNSLP